MRRSGTSAAISPRTSAAVVPVRSAFAAMSPASRSVSVAPGKTLFTVMPQGPTSFASVFAQFATAPRTVLLTPRPFNGCLTLVEMTFTMRPWPAARMPGSTAVASKWLQMRCWENVARKASARASVMGPPAGPPVLLTKMCTGSSATTAAIAASTAAGSVKSAGAMRCRPGSVSSSRAASSRSALRAMSTTRAPRPAKWRATSRPIPPDAPPTTAVIPAKSTGIHIESMLRSCMLRRYGDYLAA